MTCSKCKLSPVGKSASSLYRPFNIATATVTFSFSIEKYSCFSLALIGQPGLIVDRISVTRNRKLNPLKNSCEVPIQSMMTTVDVFVFKGTVVVLTETTNPTKGC